MRQVSIARITTGDICMEYLPRKEIVLDPDLQWVFGVNDGGVSIWDEPMGSHDPLSSGGAYRKSISFVNGCNCEIVSIDSSGVVVTIPEEGKGGTRMRSIPELLKPNSIAVITTHQFQTRDAMLQFNADINYRRKGSFTITEEQDLIQQHIVKLENSKRNSTRTTFQVNIVRRVSMTEMLSKVAVHVPGTDILLYPGPYNTAILHPLDPDYVAQHVHKRLTSKVDTEAVASIMEIVDNKSNISSRYYHMFGETVEIPVVADSTRNTGVYVTTIIDNKERTRFYSIEKAEELLGVCKVREDADFYGNQELRISTEKHRLEAEKHRLDTEKHKTDYELKQRQLIADTEKHLETLKQKQQQKQQELEALEVKLKVEAARERKFQYENEAYSKKSQLELIKMVPIIITACASVYGVFKYNNSR